MVVPRFAALALLVLLAPALVAARSLSLELTILQSMQEQCEDTTTVVDTSYFGLETEDCEDCMATLEDRANLMWACTKQVCQRKAYFAAEYPADDTTTFGCADCVATYGPNVCQLCISTVPSSIYSGLAEADVLAARAWCVKAATYKIKSSPTANVYAVSVAGDAPPFADVNNDVSKFTAAVTVCANIPETYEIGGDDVPNDWKNWCLRCLWSPLARAKPLGTLEYADWAIDGKKRPTDYGACAFQANQSFSIEVGIIKPVGIRETCVWEKSKFQPVPKTTAPLDSTFAVNECLACMDTTFEYIGLGGTQPENTTKAYACALCRHPDWITSIDMAEDCFACVASPLVYNAWGCNYCYEADVADANTGECTDCVMSNPYQDKVGSYNWACAECASIAADDLRDMCIECLLTPATEAGYISKEEHIDENPANNDDTYALAMSDFYLELEDKVFVGKASEILCSCVDMAKSSTMGDTSNWYTALCPDCTAQQRSCYKIRNYSYTVQELKDNALVTPTPILGTTVGKHLDYTLKAEIAAGSTTADACSQCMRDFIGATYTGSADSMYACEQFCMNTDTIADLEQQDQCFECLKDYRDGSTKDVTSCGLCMTGVTTANTSPDKVHDRRADCMECIHKPSTDLASRDMACVACAKLISDDARDKCFECLTDDVLDPYACVDGVTAGWLFFEAVDTNLAGCLTQLNIDEQLALPGSPLKGSLTDAPAGGFTTAQCAQIARGKGHTTFGLDDEGNCYTFTANPTFIYQLTQAPVGTTPVLGATCITTGCVCLNA